MDELRAALGFGREVGLPEAIKAATERVAERDRLRAEVERLRGGLNVIVDYGSSRKAAVMILDGLPPAEIVAHYVRANQSPMN